MGALKGGVRRKHSDEFKAEVVTQCRQAGASLSGIALSHGLNANMVRCWVRDSMNLPVAPSNEVVPQEFVALSVDEAASPPECPAPDIHVEVRHGTTTVNITWPLAASKDCASWLKLELPL